MFHSRILTSLAFLVVGLTLGARSTPQQSQQTRVAQPERAQGPTLEDRKANAPGEGAPEQKELKGYTLPPEKYQQAVAYARARHRTYFIRVAYGLLLLLLVLRWRIAPVFRDWAERSSPRRIVQALVYAPLLIVTLDILELPISLYHHWLDRKYEQSVQSWSSWLWDWTKEDVLGLLLGAVLVWILYGVIQRSPRRWWFYFWLVSVPIIVFLVFVAPVLIEPLFFKFEPLARTQPQLVAQIEKVVQRGGLNIPPDHMFEMKASKKLKSVNAYATGIGASKRVVVWDTTIQRMTSAEILSVFGHEMGHYVLGHVRKGIVFACAVLLLFLYLGYRALNGALARFGERWGVRGVDDWASLPALLLFLSVFNFLATPIINGYSRYLEHQADVYGLEVIHGVVPHAPEVAAHSLQLLGEIDLEEPDPSPFVKFWLYTHPPLDERILFARTYDPWSKGRRPQFVN